MLRARYRKIVFFFARIVFSLVFWDFLVSSLGGRKLARRNRPVRLRRIAMRYRALAVSMGGLMIKVGQFLSARVDVLPQAITDELAGLQDEVPPEDYEAIRALAEAELGKSLGECFASFESIPLAAASLGQVHRARLKVPDAIQKEGQTPVVEVVVKIQRPNIEQIITTDLAALKTVGTWLQRYRPINRRVDVPALLEEFARGTFQEIDYLAEGGNAEIFAENFSDRPDVRVPAVVWTHTTKQVLTLEDVFAIKITDYAAITAAGVSLDAVAQRLFSVYLQQIFEDSFFHADPHPGNLFVAPQEDGGWQLTFVDFGMVGQVPTNARAGLRELVIAMGTQDTARMVKVYQLLDILLPNADLELIQQAEAMVFDRFWGKSMAELQDISWDEMHEFAKEFRGLIFDMPFQVPQDLIFLGRAIAILAGMCTGLDKDFNFWRSIAPYAQDLMTEDGESNWQVWLEEAGRLFLVLLSLPGRLDRVLSRLENGQMAVRVPEIQSHLWRIERSGRQMKGAVIFMALLLGGVQLYVADETTLGGVLLGMACVILLWILIPSRRSH